MAEEKKPSKIKKIKAAGQMRKIMADYFYELDAASKSDTEKVAWCTSVGPAELLHSFGFKVYYPENHGAMLGATRMATDLIPLANARGFSPDICSYLTADIGSYLKGETPLQKMGMKGVPKADVLVFNTNQCRDVKDWFQWYARQWNVPCVDKWRRKDQFYFFKDYDNPFFNICTELDITKLYRYVHDNDISFFKASLYLSLKSSK